MRDRRSPSCVPGWRHVGDRCVRRRRNSGAEGGAPPEGAVGGGLVRRGEICYNIQGSEPVVEMQTGIKRKWRPEGRRRRHGRWRRTSTWPLAGGDQASTTDLTMTPSR
jgi:hypothetical protein